MSSRQRRSSARGAEALARASTLRRRMAALLREPGAVRRLCSGTVMAEAAIVFKDVNKWLANSCARENNLSIAAGEVWWWRAVGIGQVHVIRCVTARAVQSATWSCGGRHHRPAGEHAPADEGGRSSSVTVPHMTASKTSCWRRMKVRRRSRAEAERPARALWARGLPRSRALTGILGRPAAAGGHRAGAGAAAEISLREPTSALARVINEG